MTTSKIYEFIITKLDGQIKIESKDCKFPLNTNLHTTILNMFSRNEIIDFYIKDKNSNKIIKDKHLEAIKYRIKNNIKY